MQEYLLLLRGGNERFNAMSPEEIQATIAKYRDWGQRLRESGRLLGSNKLTDESGRTLAANGTGSAHVTDGPYVETKDAVGGYYLIQAESYDDAVEISRGCPHLQFGAIEVRQIEKM